MIQEFPVISILRIWAFLSISLLSGGAWSAGPCDQPQSEAVVSQCLAIELQNVYSKLSMAYRNQIAAALPRRWLCARWNCYNGVLGRGVGVLFHYKGAIQPHVETWVVARWHNPKVLNPMTRTYFPN